jgi:hypothetical protein
MTAVCAALLCTGTAFGKTTPPQKCEAGKNNAAGKYTACRQTANKAFVLNNDATTYDTAITKCQTTLSKQWGNLETAAANAKSACPTTGDESTVQSTITDFTSCLSGNLAGGTPAADCDPSTLQDYLNDCNSNLTSYEDYYNTCETSLSTCDTNLSTCDTSLSACETNCASIPLATCEANLATCQGQGGALPPAQLLQTGQTICWDGNGYVIACSGTGQDGALQEGVALAYTDNGDGTITDNNTGLTWEKKDVLDGTVNAANLEDADNCYPWSGTCGPGGVACGTDADCEANGPCQAADCQTASPDGLTIFKWVAQLNTASFARHNDWRIPNLRELQSLVDSATSNPSVAPAFNGASCGAGCTDITSAACSCTGGYYYWYYGYYYGYWSSTTYQPSPSYAWTVSFYDGHVSYNFKSNNFYVRAVRGGS